MADLGFDEWMAGGSSPMSESNYAIRQWRLIQRKPVSITLTRGTTTIAAQTVRVEYGNEERREPGASGALTVKRDVVVFGVKGHESEDVPDTNIAKGDIFVYEGQRLKVTDVFPKVGMIEAHCERFS
jgi:hypothetical protein